MMASAGHRRNISQIVEHIFGDWLDVRRLWQDRTLIIFNPMEALDGTRPPHDPPWRFAPKALLLPAGVVAAVISAVTFFVKLPPSGIEQAIHEQQQLQVVLADARQKLVQPQPSKERPFARWTDQELEKRLPVLLARVKELRAIKPATPEVEAQLEKTVHEYVAVVDEQVQRTMADLGLSFVRAQEEALRNETFLKAVGKLNELAERWRFAILGATLLLNAFTFRWLIRRRLEFEAQDDADRAHLYLTGAALFVPNFVIGVANILVDIGSRYPLEWLPTAYQLLSVSLVVWVLLRLRSIVPVLTMQLAPAANVSVRRAQHLVANRLVLSNIISFMIVNVVLGLVGVPILYWLIQHPQ